VKPVEHSHFLIPSGSGLYESCPSPVNDLHNFSVRSSAFMSRSMRPSVGVGNRGRLRGLVVLIALILSAGLVACGDDGGSAVQDDRRFATDPEPAATMPPATATTVPDSTQAPISVPNESASPESTLVPAASSVANLFVLVEGDVIVVDVSTGLSRTIAESTATSQIEHVAPLPDGHSAAILSSRVNQSGTYDLVILTADGVARTSWSHVSALLEPARGEARGQLAADWDAHGTRLAVAFPEGGAVVVHLAGIPEVLLWRSQAPAPMEIAWSPDGEAIAFTSRDREDDRPYVAIGGVRVLPIDPVRIAGTGGARPIHQIVWEPGGERLFAIQGSASQRDLIGGDLISIDRRTLSPAFAIGGSRFGPGVQIVWAEPAPDSDAWALVTIAPASTSGVIASVWTVTDLLQTVNRLDLGENPPVSGVAWTEVGLTVSLQREGIIEIAHFDVVGDPVPIASPIASPVADVSSPVASPESASPEASPATAD
jgi:hypothetical protein